MLDEPGDQQVATRASAFGIPPERSAWVPSMVDDPIQYWVRIIRGEYLEIPGLFLTPSQVQRLWELDAVVCDQVLNTLVGLRFLRRTPEGAFVRDHQRRD
jgi:hypothetical protein